MTPEVTTPGRKGFYGWFALAGVMLTSFFVIGTFLISFAVFLPVMCSELGWSRAAISTGLTLGLLCNGLFGPFWGFLVNRFGPRAIIVLGSTVIALGLAGMYLIQEVWHVYIFYSLAGLGVGLAGMVATSTVANNWFVRKRSLAMGQVPDGEPVGPYEEIRALDYIPDAGKAPAEWRIMNLFRMPTTWLIATFTVSYALALGTTGTHQVAYIQDIGFSPMIAATTFSLVSGIAMLGSMGFGTLAIRFNIRYLASAFFGIQLIALCILLSTENLTLIYIYAVLYGIGNGALLVALPTFIGAYYERRYYSRIVGIISPFQVVPQAAAATIAGAIFDATNSYTPAFILITVFSIVGLVCAFLARQPKLPQANGLPLPV